MKNPDRKIPVSRSIVLKAALMIAVVYAVTPADPEAEAHPTPLATPTLAPIAAAPSPAAAAAPSHTFGFRGSEFVLDGKPFQIMAGEMHFQRIPREYWKDRLLKAKALGLNTIGTYIFWNALEPKPGQWDFSGRNDLAAFIELAQEVGLWVLVRPGPYACAEWDFGGLPIWLLRQADAKVRCSDPGYLNACRGYIEKIAGILKPLQIHNGGPVLMLQIENEYGSYGNDREYLKFLTFMWNKSGITVRFSTADGATPYMLEAGSIPGCAIGLDPAASEKEFAEAEKLGRNVPIFCSELYPGWLTHWGEPWAKAATEDTLKDLRWLLDNKKSFSLYVVHGGTNFGFWAGANMGKTYQPDVTSYDYDAPINERGEPTPKYFAIRELLGRYQPDGIVLPDLPAPIPAIETPDISFETSAGLFDNLPQMRRLSQPKPMETLGQNHGFILYRTNLVGHHSGKLTIWDLHDYANIYIDGDYLGTLDRAKGENSIEIPKTDPPAQTLDILVEGMGRINFSQYIIDRKGITDRVTLNGMTLMNWEIACLPMDEGYPAGLGYGKIAPDRPAMFFKGTFELDELGDTYLDMTGWKKGVVWVNGHNLGRYWEIGPQKRLYCPAPFLLKGRNVIVVFDLHQTKPAVIRGFKSLE